MKTYKVNDVVWLAKYDREQVDTECPICFGKRTVRLILGNDDEVTLPCEFCGKGYNAPTGRILEWKLIVSAKQVTITDCRCESTAEGDKYEYYSDHTILTDRIFDTKEEAETKCEEFCKKDMETEIVRARSVKGSTNKNYSWVAGYHTREAKRCREDAERHERHAVILKAKARKPKEKS